MFLIYDLLISLVVAMAVLPWHFLLILSRKFTWENLQQRLGTNHIPRKLKVRRILIHATSLGEVAAAEPLTREILRAGSDIELVLTTGNNDGMSAAKRLQGFYPAIIYIQFLPWDEKVMLASWIRRLNPDMVLILETELWPNFIRECKRLNIPVCIVNGRVYPRDVSRYRLVRRFFHTVFSYVDWIGAQSERERERFLSIGAGSQQIEVMGNVKFDASLPQCSDSEKVDALLKAVPMLLVGGSTHPREEYWLLESFRDLRKDFTNLRLVLAPRHTQRAGSVERLVRRFGLQPMQWSASDRDRHNWDVLILDQTGWLPDIYRHAAVVVIGGSFVDHGGHNFLEAARWGKPIIVGPFMKHFRELADDFIKADAMLQLQDQNQIRGIVQHLLASPVERSNLGNRALAMLEHYKGISVHYKDKLHGFLPDGVPI